MNEIKIVMQFLGLKAVKWLVLGVFFSIVLSGVEYFVAAYMQVLLVKVDFAGKDQLPAALVTYVNLTIGQLSLVLVGVGFVRAFAQFFTSQSGNIFNQLIGARMRLMTSFEVLKASHNKLIPASEVHFRFAEIFPKVGSFVSSSTNFLVGATQTIFLVIGIFYVAPKESAVGILSILILGFPLRSIQKGIHHLANGTVSDQEAISKLIERITRNWLFLKISRTENLEYSSLVSKILSHFRAIARTGILIRLSGLLPQVVGTTILAILIYYGHKINHTSGSQLVAFLYLFIRFVQQSSTTVDTLGNTISLYPQFKLAYKSYKEFNSEDLNKALFAEDFLTILSAPKKFYVQDERKLVSAETKSDIRTPPEIKVEDVTYRWSDNSQNVFENFSAVFESGKITGIKGESGKGKSTLLLLMLGQVKPVSGSIKIGELGNGEILDELGPQLGYVGAEPFLIEGSIRDNLSYGLSHIPCDQEILQALELAQLKPMIEKLPGNLDYRLTESQEGLSTGQKQRMSIARALLRNPKLLIFDEATANLDMETEMEIAAMLNNLKGRCTVVIVTHRDGILKFSDKVIRL